MINIGKEMFKWATDLFPINRSITGEGVRKTLNYLKKIIPELEIQELPSGTKCFDWEIPNEWELDYAYIDDEFGNRVVDFNNSNLHVIGYSTSIDEWMNLDELNNHLHSIENIANAIPYITSYYKETWGFCLKHSERKTLKKCKYHVVIKSRLFKGFLNYGELILPGKSEKEILLSTYICHPSMANNEVSGPVVTTALVKWLKNLDDRVYTYRIIFIPETIGSIAYLSKNWELMKQNTIAGFVLTCVGDNNSYSLMPSRLGNTYADAISQHICNNFLDNYNKFSFLERGSDERQFCSPLIDLPVVSIMRTKYGKYPEYHTSLDNLDFISIDGLLGAYEINKKCLEAIEYDKKYITTIFCEPKMDKRGLRDTISGINNKLSMNSINIMNFLMYSDGANLLNIAEKIQLNIEEANNIANLLLEHNLIKCINE